MDSTLLQAIHEHYLRDEDNVVSDLQTLARSSARVSHHINEEARRLVQEVRAWPKRLSPLERLLTEYELTTNEGMLLMCLAETLLRIPDKGTADLLIADKIKCADWEKHLDHRDLLVNASTWGLILSGRILANLPSAASDQENIWRGMLARLGEPVIRNTIRLAMRIIGNQFVMGETIEKALERASADGRIFEDFSFDMLGEAALTSAEAEGYLASYLHAIESIDNTADDQHDLGVSVKLSALCPRFDVFHWRRARRELVDKLGQLVRAAGEKEIFLTVDAEESEKLMLSLEVFAEVLGDRANRDWHGLGLAVQAYQKRAIPVLHWLESLARKTECRIPVRLVKGAYWDTEIKLAQVRGLEDFPVFTRKCNTDLSYLAAILTLSELKDWLQPQFATHNAYSVACVKAFFSPGECEFQRLHGMGEALYEVLNDNTDTPYRCRVYAPVGNHDVLLPYLARRLLENGASTSFVHRIADQDVPTDAIVADPMAQVHQNTGQHRHPAVVMPAQMFQPKRRNSPGINLADRTVVARLLEDIEENPIAAIEKGKQPGGTVMPVLQPATGRVIGETLFPTADAIDAAINSAASAWQHWESKPAESRAALLEKTAELLEANRPRLLSLCMHEAGKTISDAHDEIREAIDFLRFYAAECRCLFDVPRSLPGPVGEDNRMLLRGKGVFFCISPWNFPIAIFTGQVAAALTAGNTVLAKPAEYTTAIAEAVTALFHEAGIPEDVLHCIPGEGPNVAAQVLPNKHIAGVAFTGSGEVARSITRKLAERTGPIPTFIAETGGINAMLVDSTALPEQVVKDAVQSAFNSAGQRCSALRVLYLQEEIADHVTSLIRGCMDELVLGDPANVETDIGPIISAQARDEIQAYLNTAAASGRLLHQAGGDIIPDKGFFVAPALVSLDCISNLDKEVFGPVLHVVRFQGEDIMALCDEINATGYALTFGIHSRINHRIDAVSRRILAGNVYVNRNMIGAVVESQPFGGSFLSGTGPKAGGPNYLVRFSREQSVSNNTAAIGGDPEVFSISE